MGELGCVQQHLEQNSGCDFFEVKCVNYRYYSWPHPKVVCGVRVERRFLTDHQKNECKYRQYTCEYCGHIDTYDAIAGTGSVRANQYLFGNMMNHYGKCAEFPIKCPNECGVTSLKRKDLKAHLGTCPLESISCPFSNCSLGSILRKDVETHIKVCYYRPYTCEHCGTAGTYLSITIREGSPCHYDTCDHYPIACPNKCGISEKRKDMPTHQDTCPLQPTDCHSRLSVALQQLHVKIWTVMFR